MYQLTLNNFSGPLGLLLNLVEEKKLSINEVSLAQVADQYIAYIKSAPALSKEELAQFIVVAATLILIKSRSLLPSLAISEEETDIKELETRLATYKFFKALAEHLNALYKRNSRLFCKEPYGGLGSAFLAQNIFIPPENISKETLGSIIVELVRSIAKTEALDTEMILKTISLEEKINELKGMLENKLKTTFQEMKKGAKEKMEIIVSFLAILELIKQGFLAIEQDSAFGTIKLKKNDSARPTN